MKKIKFTFLMALISLFFLLSCSACTIDEKGMISKYEIIKGEKEYYQNGDWSIDVEGVVLLFSDDTVVGNYYYTICLFEEDLGRYNCKSYKEILTNKEFIENNLGKNSKYYYFYTGETQTNNRQLGVSINTILFNDSPSREAMIYIYTNNEIYDISKDLLNYVTSVKIKIS